MFQINEDLSIYVTRGDVLTFTVSAEEDGVLHTFQPGDVLRFKVYERKAAENVILQKEFPITVWTTAVEMLLTEVETKIGDVISKPVDYWYEVELNPLTNPQTIIGYDDMGAKIFRVLPEGADVPDIPVDPEDIPVVDPELDLTSERPVQNQAVARAVAELENDIVVFNSRFNNMASLKAGGTTGDAEVHDIRVGHDGTVYESAGDAVRGQYRQLVGRIDTAAAEVRTWANSAKEYSDSAAESLEATLVAEENAKAEVENAKAEVEKAKVEVENAKTEVTNAKAEVENAKAEVEKARAAEVNAKTYELATGSLVQTAKAYNDQTLVMIEENNKRLGLATFDMDEDGNLTYTDGTQYDFTVDDKGLLNYVVSV